jgi:hypothetical protein
MIGRTDPRPAKGSVSRDPAPSIRPISRAHPDEDGYGRGTANERVVAVYVRVVRFTDVSAERIEGALSRITESGGPPPGVSSTRLEMLFDASQGTAVVLQYFETLEDMQAGAQVLSAMDASETPGVRASVDMCEVKLSLTPS